MGLFEVIGNVGGLQQVLYLIANFIVARYANISFKIEAINFMYSVKTKVDSLVFHENNLQINFVQKVQLIMNFCPNPQMKRFIAKGDKRLQEDLEMFSIIKQHKHHHIHLKQQDEDIIKHDSVEEV